MRRRDVGLRGVARLNLPAFNRRIRSAQASSGVVPYRQLAARRQLGRARTRQRRRLIGLWFRRLGVQVPSATLKERAAQTAFSVRLDVVAVFGFRPAYVIRTFFGFVVTAIGALLVGSGSVWGSPMSQASD